MLKTAYRISPSLLLFLEKESCFYKKRSLINKNNQTIFLHSSPLHSLNQRHVLLNLSKLTSLLVFSCLLLHFSQDFMTNDWKHDKILAV